MGIEAPQQSSTLFYSNLSQGLLNTTEQPLPWETHSFSCQRTQQLYLDEMSSFCGPSKHIVQTI